LNPIDQHTAAIDELAARIEVVIQTFRRFRDLICTIPGIGGNTADVIVDRRGHEPVSLCRAFGILGRHHAWLPPIPPTATPERTTSPGSTPEKARNKAIRQLEAMGYHVTLEQAS